MSFWSRTRSSLLLRGFGTRIAGAVVLIAIMWAGLALVVGGLANG